jgi:hypothetical protein
VVLNTRRVHDFQDAFKKMEEALEMVYRHGKGLFRGQWWPVSPKLEFDQMEAAVPEIMDVCGSIHAFTHHGHNHPSLCLYILHPFIIRVVTFK